MNEPEYQFDAFISYSHKDADWVGNYLLPILRSWNVKAAVDRSELLPGDRISRKLWDLISASRHVLFVCTRSFLRSEWCGEELEMVKSRYPGVLRRKAIPIALEKDSVPDLLSTTIWCDLSEGRDRTDDWRKLCASLGGVWSGETDRILRMLFDLSVFFGGYLNNSEPSIIVARSHGGKFQGVEEAASIETTLAIANTFALFSKLGKTENIFLVLSNDWGEANEVLGITDANYVFIGGTVDAYDQIPRLTGRHVDYAHDEDTGVRYYVIEKSVRVELRDGMLSFLIYKSETSYAGNVLFFFSPWPIGSLSAVKLFRERYGSFVTHERSKEFLYVFEFTLDDQPPTLTYEHKFAPEQI